MEIKYNLIHNRFKYLGSLLLNTLNDILATFANNQNLD